LKRSNHALTPFVLIEYNIEIEESMALRQVLNLCLGGTVSEFPSIYLV